MVDFRQQDAVKNVLRLRPTLSSIAERSGKTPVPSADLFFTFMIEGKDQESSFVF
jgi:hypothetical protein